MCLSFDDESWITLFAQENPLKKRRKQSLKGIRNSDLWKQLILKFLLLGATQEIMESFWHESFGRNPDRQITTTTSRVKSEQFYPKFWIISEIVWIWITNVRVLRLFKLRRFARASRTHRRKGWWDIFFRPFPFLSESSVTHILVLSAWLN